MLAPPGSVSLRNCSWCNIGHWSIFECIDEATQGPAVVWEEDSSTEGTATGARCRSNADGRTAALAACVPELKCRWIYNVQVLMSIQAWVLCPSEEVVASYNVQVLLWDAGEFKWVPVQMQQLCPPEKEGGRIVDCKAEASAALATASPVNHFCSHLRPWGVSPLTQWQSHDDQPHFLVLLWSLSLRSVIWSFCCCDTMDRKWAENDDIIRPCSATVLV